MKGDIHSFHLRYRSMISTQRLKSYECYTFLTLLCLVVIEIDGRKPWCSHETLAGIRIRKSLPQHMMMHINFMRYAERSGEGAWSKAPRPR